MINFTLPMYEDHVMFNFAGNHESARSRARAEFGSKRLVLFCFSFRVLVNLVSWYSVLCDLCFKRVDTLTLCNVSVYL